LPARTPAPRLFAQNWQSNLANRSIQHLQGQLSPEKAAVEAEVNDIPSGRRAPRMRRDIPVAVAQILHGECGCGADQFPQGTQRQRHIPSQADLRLRHIFAARICGERRPQGKMVVVRRRNYPLRCVNRALCAYLCAKNAVGRVRAGKHFAPPRRGQVTSCIPARAGLEVPFAQSRSCSERWP
jgi:hypothetical protein